MRCPAGPPFPDWRSPRAPTLLKQLARPFDGIAFDIEHGEFWWDAWGPRPQDRVEAVALARRQIAGAPRLIPVYGHRYLPAEPDLAGNPVFSVHQTDIIFYGVDLRRYLAHEFGALDHAAAAGGETRRIRFWTDLVESEW